MSVIDDLHHWGPDVSRPIGMSREQAEEYCRRLAQSHYENFPVVTWLLPGELHQHFYNVYAFCRWADDLGDETGDPERSLELLSWWRGELQQCYRAVGGGTGEQGRQTATEHDGDRPLQGARQDQGFGSESPAVPGEALERGGERGERTGLGTGESAICPQQAAREASAPRHPVFVALAPTIRRFGIPMTPFDDLIRAFEQDQRVREYETFAQLVDYCTRSANPVGRLVLYLCEQFSEDNARYADSICTGLQLANFWQDVARDYDIGRIYLPKEDRERFGYSDDDCRNRVTSDAFLNLMQFEVAWARQFLRAGYPLVERMPGRIQIDVELFVRGGLAILKGIERIEFRVWERRPTVSKWDVLCAGLGAISGYVRRGFPRRGSHPKIL